MKVLYPMTIHECQGDCPFSFTTPERILYCVYNENMVEVPKGVLILDNCPLKEYIVK
jgi:hypothetical protein